MSDDPMLKDSRESCDISVKNLRWELDRLRVDLQLERNIHDTRVAALEEKLAAAIESQKDLALENHALREKLDRVQFHTRD